MLAIANMLWYTLEVIVDYGKEWVSPLFTLCLGLVRQYGREKNLAKKLSTAEAAAELARPIVEEMGLELWDVRFEKEGSIWYLRYYVDKEGGITIEDCEKFSRAVEKSLDEADPIESSYTLEVSSPGIERELTRPAHFEKLMGETVSVRFIRPIEGVRDFIGELSGYEDGNISILLDEETEMTFSKDEVSFVRLYNDYND